MSATTADATGLKEVVALLEGKKALVLGGAGISTESGIPDYRGPESSKRPRSPMRFQQFVGSEAARRRYWARSMVGWERVAEARPNSGHRALAALEASGHVTGLITQNVDGLHQAAGSKRVLELHGSLAAIRCLSCGSLSSRRKFQAALLALNPAVPVEALEIAPDGDAELNAELEQHFKVPDCAHCGGVLKPDVVFFGENVPKARVLHAYGMLGAGRRTYGGGLVADGFSGYRFVVRAAKEGKPVVILNDGETRGDAQATLKCSGRLGRVLPELSSLLEV